MRIFIILLEEFRRLVLKEKTLFVSIKMYFVVRARYSSRLIFAEFFFPAPGHHELNHGILKIDVTFREVGFIQMIVSQDPLTVDGHPALVVPDQAFLAKDPSQENLRVRGV